VPHLEFRGTEHTTTVTSTHPLGFPMGVSLKQEKLPRLEGASFIFGAGEKERLKFVWG
ncbi:uncharacterized protein METZ01_LOCUS407893, partial [marine metagenome]